MGYTRVTELKSPSPNPLKFIWVIMAVIVVVFVVANTIVIIQPGERGVVLEWGRVTGNIFNEGLHFKIPIANNIDVMNVKTQKLETSSSAASKDLQIVTSTIALNYKVKPDAVTWLRQNIGLNYQQIIIDPAIQEAIKASTAKFTAEELITKRPLVRDEMKIALQEKLDLLSSYSIRVEEFNIVNFDFSAEFNAAIEEKVTAEQLALKSERDLERIKIEAQQKIETAKAEAESIRIQSEALKENPDILQLRWIEKWTGVVPYFVAGGSESLIFQMPQV